MSACLFPGSFDPPTAGHLDLIARAAALFDEVIVAVLGNIDKKPAFSPAERVDMLARCAAEAGLTNVRIVAGEGLTIELAARERADVLLRGLRGESDCAPEQWLAAANKKLGGLETLLLFTAPELSYISSSMVREAAKYGAPLEGMVPPAIALEVRARLGAPARIDGARIDESKGDGRR